MYTISIDGKDFIISGAEAAYEAFQAATCFAEIFGGQVYLFSENGEILAES